MAVWTFFVTKVIEVPVIAKVSPFTPVPVRLLAANAVVPSKILVPLNNVRLALLMVSVPGA